MSTWCFTRRPRAEADPLARPTYVSFTETGRRIFVVFGRVDEVTIEIIAAYEPERD